jgi:hypothetical protein
MCQEAFGCKTNAAMLLMSHVADLALSCPGSNKPAAATAVTAG